MTDADGPNADRTLVRSVRWWAHPRALWHYVTSLHDTPHAIALGAAIGMFVGMTPTVGIQMILVGAIWYAVKPLFHFNCKVGLIAVYVSNPVTTLPIFWFNYCIGVWFLGRGMTFAEFSDILRDVFRPGNPDAAGWFGPLIALFVKIGWPLVLGSAIVAIVCAVVTYPVVWYAMRSYVRRTKRRLAATADENGPAESEPAQKTVSVAGD
ncbi:MAG: DUF2062 domain-containing protein [Planctomycetota bacterium]